MADIYTVFIRRTRSSRDEGDVRDDTRDSRRPNIALHAWITQGVNLSIRDSAASSHLIRYIYIYIHDSATIRSYTECGQWFSLTQRYRSTERHWTWKFAAGNHVFFGANDRRSRPSAVRFDGTKVKFCRVTNITWCAARVCTARTCAAATRDSVALCSGSSKRVTCLIALADTTVSPLSKKNCK